IHSSTEIYPLSLHDALPISHGKVLADCQKEVDEFLAAARLLGPKLLCCVLQFGYFNRNVFVSVRVFLDRLSPFVTAWPVDVPVADRKSTRLNSSHVAISYAV